MTCLLDGRRQDQPHHQRLVLFYKIINGLASVETKDILTPADSRTRKNHSFKYLKANCDSYRFSFFTATISSWNNLTFGIEKVDSVEGFKLKLKEHTIRSPYSESNIGMILNLESCQLTIRIRGDQARKIVFLYESRVSNRFYTISAIIWLQIFWNLKTNTFVTKIARDNRIVWSSLYLIWQ